ncbi:MAG: peptidylprolyl isomerase [Solobacterium sp.]|nr:peptidylprolyl isomerase [Solobacterium sp.]
MNTFLKKNWFVVLVAAAFACISIFYIYDTNKGKLKGKTVNGEGVIYSIGDKDVTASGFYDDLYKQGGSSAVVTMFTNAVAEAGVEATDQMKEDAAAQAEYIISNYKNNYGSEYESKLAADLASTGYTSVEDYLLMDLKRTKLVADYAKAHFDELKIRSISYILIKFEDSANKSAEGSPTEDESKRMAAVDEALKNGTFEDAAKEFSEDDSTKSSGGALGIIDANTTSLDTAFLNAALALNEGEVSDWVYSGNFGYFRIMATATTPEKLEADSLDVDPYESLTSNYDTTLANTAIWEKAQEIGFDFKGNEDLEKAVTSALAPSEDKPEEEASDIPVEEVTEEEGEEEVYDVEPVDSEEPESEDDN